MKSVVQGKNWLRMVSFVQPSLPTSRLACHFLSARPKLTLPRLCYLLLDRPSTTDPTSPRLPSRHQQKSPSCYEGRTSCFLTRSRSTICRWRGWRTLWYAQNTSLVPLVSICSYCPSERRSDACLLLSTSSRRVLLFSSPSQQYDYVRPLSRAALANHVGALKTPTMSI